MVEDWDIIILTETWRTKPREFFVTIGGHMFAGAGCDAGRRGVAFLVHKRWRHNIKEFHVVNERIAYLRLWRRHLKMRVIGAYFPHGGYSDTKVQEVYSALSEIHREATSWRESTILGGDFNAEVGRAGEHDCRKVIGKHGLNNENHRGQWLKNRCGLEKFSLTNTFYPKHDDAKYT